MAGQRPAQRPGSRQYHRNRLLHAQRRRYHLRPHGRHPDAKATYVIPTENEWYKAAYYKGGSTNAGYWRYATQSNTLPSNILSAVGTNNASYDAVKPGGSQDIFTDPANLYTPVGAFAASPSASGTFDQAGDIWNWTEAALSSTLREVRGGCYSSQPLLGSDEINSSWRNGTHDPADYNFSMGLRIALVPEPASLLLLAPALLLLCPRRCRRVTPRIAARVVMRVPWGARGYVRRCLRGRGLRARVELGFADRRTEVVRSS